MSLFGRREPELTKTERFTQREFDDAIRFCEEEWKGFERYLLHVNPDATRKYTLKQRLTLFEGPVSQELETRFPRITEVAEDMRRRTGVSEGKTLLLGAIAKEALVRAGEDRAELRKIIDG